jgi:hypothetical protein
VDEYRAYVEHDPPIEMPESRIEEINADLKKRGYQPVQKVYAKIKIREKDPAWNKAVQAALHPTGNPSEPDPDLTRGLVVDILRGSNRTNGAQGKIYEEDEEDPNQGEVFDY